METVEQASAMDKAWFEAHPMHRHRLRTALPDEFTAEMGERCPAGFAIAVSVERVSSTFRLRDPLAIVPLLTGCLHLTEAQLAEAWRAHADERRSCGQPVLVADEIHAAAAANPKTDGSPDLAAGYREVMIKRGLTTA
ncbi:hypothetical protein ACFYO1_29585 [Nocardia sp. NPDC006044]|uniref:hypothetical protein n=1 Tax=Nocardia sp. NPDC006044 TaxID=3364306 RepID=UPI00367373CD